MRFLKTIIINVFIGFYFLSITPVHFYAHNFDSHDSQKQSLEDCSYIKLINIGQGNFLAPDIITHESPIELSSIFKNFVVREPSLVSSYYPFNFNLRAPPAQGC